MRSPGVHGRSLAPSPAKTATREVSRENEAGSSPSHTGRARQRPRSPAPAAPAAVHNVSQVPAICAQPLAHSMRGRDVAHRLHTPLAPSDAVSSSRHSATPNWGTGSRGATLPTQRRTVPPHVAAFCPHELPPFFPAASPSGFGGLHTLVSKYFWGCPPSRHILTDV